MVTIDDLEGPGEDAEELPTTEEFFLPGSGASRGLTSQDLEVSRTATWEDNMVTIDDLEGPGLDSEELPYTEEFFLPGSGASRGLTTQDLEASRTLTWEDSNTTIDENEEDEGEATAGSSPFMTGREGSNFSIDMERGPLVSPSIPDTKESDGTEAEASQQIAQASATSSLQVERLRARFDAEYAAAFDFSQTAGAEEGASEVGSAPGWGQLLGPVEQLDDGDMTEEEAAEWTEETQSFQVEELIDESPQGRGDYAAQGPSVLLSDAQLYDQDAQLVLDDAALLAEQMMLQSEGTRVKRRTRKPVDAFSGQEIVLRSASCMVPHPLKVQTGGEDACFISNDGSGAIGIADGVSAWADDDIDPAAFSRQLVDNLQEALDVVEWQDNEEGLREVLHAAHKSATALGSATLILAAGGANGIVHVANLGDCGLRLIHEGTCTFATQDMLHGYNLPFQLARIEEDEDKYEAADTPDAADLYDIETSPGDVLVLASDGLFDNLFDEEVASIIDDYIDEERSQASAARAASALASAAQAKVGDLQSHTPWIRTAARSFKLPVWNLLNPRGGKEDDITVVVALVNSE